jgi:hypothetical protein
MLIIRRWWCDEGEAGSPHHFSPAPEFFAFRFWFFLSFFRFFFILFCDPRSFVFVFSYLELVVEVLLRFGAARAW